VRDERRSLHCNINRPAIIDTVIKIVEGGSEAFQERSRRYRGRLGGT
jgi:hypothetical protein